jgi:hypothetical protein
LKPKKKSRSKIGNKTYIKIFFFAKKVGGIHKYSTKKFWMPEKFFGFHKTERCHFWCQHLMVMVNHRDFLSQKPSFPGDLCQVTKHNLNRALAGKYEKIGKNSQSCNFEGHNNIQQDRNSEFRNVHFLAFFMLIINI